MLKRKLTAREKFLWLLGREEPFIIQWTAKLTGYLTPESLRKALDFIQILHPILNTKIILKEDYYFSPNLQPIKLRCHHRQNQTTWEKIAIDVLSNPLPYQSNEHIFALDWVKGTYQHELIFSFDHAFSDARCLVALVQRFLAIVDKILANESIKMEPFSPLPPLEEMLPTNKPEYTDKTLMATPFSNNEFQTITSPPYAYRLPYIKQFSIAQTAQLLQLAKRWQSSLHGLLCAGLILTLDKELQEKNNITDSFCFTPADIRPYLKTTVSAEEFGNFASGIIHPFHVGERKPIRHIARSITVQIQELFASNQIAKNLLDFRKNYHQQITPAQAVKAIKIRDQVTALSNVGIIDINKDFRHFTFEHGQFSVSSPIMTGHQNLYWVVASTVHSKLQIEFFHNIPCTDESQMPMFANELMNLLNSLYQGGDE